MDVLKEETSFATMDVETSGWIKEYNEQNSSVHVTCCIIAWHVMRLK